MISFGYNINLGNTRFDRHHIMMSIIILGGKRMRILSKKDGFDMVVERMLVQPSYLDEFINEKPIDIQGAGHGKGLIVYGGNPDNNVPYTGEQGYITYNVWEYIKSVLVNIKTKVKKLISSIDWFDFKDLLSKVIAEYFGGILGWYASDSSSEKTTNSSVVGSALVDSTSEYNAVMVTIIGQCGDTTRTTMDAGSTPESTKNTISVFIKELGKVQKCWDVARRYCNKSASSKNINEAMMSEISSIMTEDLVTNRASGAVSPQNGLLAAGSGSSILSRHISTNNAGAVLFTMKSYICAWLLAVSALLTGTVVAGTLFGILSTLVTVLVPIGFVIVLYKNFTNKNTEYTNTLLTDTRCSLSPFESTIADIFFYSFTHDLSKWAKYKYTGSYYLNEFCHKTRFVKNWEAKFNALPSNNPVQVQEAIYNKIYLNSQPDENSVLCRFHLYLYDKLMALDSLVDDVVIYNDDNLAANVVYKKILMYINECPLKGTIDLQLQDERVVSLKVHDSYVTKLSELKNIISEEIRYNTFLLELEQRRLKSPEKYYYDCVTNTDEKAQFGESMKMVSNSTTLDINAIEGRWAFIAKTLYSKVNIPETTLTSMLTTTNTVMDMVTGSFNELLDNRMSREYHKVRLAPLYEQFCKTYSIPIEGSLYLDSRDDQTYKSAFSTKRPASDRITNFSRRTLFSRRTVSGGVISKQDELKIDTSLVVAASIGTVFGLLASM